MIPHITYMDEERKRENLKIFISVIFGIALLGFLTYKGIYKCPMKFLFGIPCPCCGMTRAIFSVLKGNIRESFYYHPVWPIVVLTVVIEFMYELGYLKISSKTAGLIAAPAIIALIVCYIIRLSLGITV